MSGLNSEVIKKIKKLRVEQGLSQERLSELAGLDPKYINKLENGRFNLTLPTLERIINGLQMSNDDFFYLLINSRVSDSEIVNELLDSMNIEKKNKVLQSIKELLLALEN